MNKKNFWLSIPISLNFISLLSLIVLLVKIFFLNNIPEIIHGFYQLGLVVEGLLASILASYIFYVFVVHTKETKDNKAIYPYISKLITRIVGHCQYQINSIGNSAGLDLSWSNLTEDALKSAMGKIHPYSDAPLVIASSKKANWLVFFKDMRDRTVENITDIMSQLIYLDSNLIARLSELKDSSHLHTSVLLLHYKINNESLENLSSSFYQYYLLCRDLEEYASKMKT